VTETDAEDGAFGPVATKIRVPLPDFPDALVALKFLQRDGDGPEASYSNTPESAFFLDQNSPSYIGGILEMANARLYRFWADLTEGLKTGKPQNEAKHSGEPMFFDDALPKADVITMG
jgi:hypothetical protein